MNSLDKYDGYLDALRSLGVADAISSSAEQDLREVAFRSIFYSRLDEPQRHNPHEMLLDGGIDIRDGHFQDYMLLLSLDKIGLQLKEMQRRDMHIGDVTGMMEAAFGSMLGRYSNKGYRQYTNRTGDTGVYVTLEPHQIGEELESIIKAFNSNANDNAELLLNSLVFFLDFVKLHPKENGNGRLARLFCNGYLTGNGILPMTVVSLKESNDMYLRSIGVQHMSGYIGGFLGWAIVSMIGKSKIREILDNAPQPSPHNPHEIELHIILSVLSNATLDRDRVGRTAEWMYERGAKLGNESLRQAALWISTMTRLENTLLEKAVSECDDGTVAMGLLLMEMRDYDRYVDHIKKIAKFGGNHSRMAAIGILGRHAGGFDDELIEWVVKNEPNPKIVGLLARALREVERDRALAIIERLMGRDEDVIRFNAYRSQIALAEDGELPRLIRASVEVGSERLAKGVIEVVSGMSKLDTPGVPEILSEAAKRRGDIRKVLLGELLLSRHVDPEYVHMCSQIMKGDYDAIDNAYATYLVGREKGLGYINSEFGRAPYDPARSTFENTATILAYVKDLGEGKNPPRINESVFNDPDALFVLTLELSRKREDKAVYAELSRVLGIIEGRNAMEVAMRGRDVERGRKFSKAFVLHAAKSFGFDKVHVSSNGKLGKKVRI